MPSYPGQLKFVARNIFSAVLFLDMANPADLKIIEEIFSFVKGSIPLRFGFIPMVDKDPSSPREPFICP